MDRSVRLQRLDLMSHRPAILAALGLFLGILSLPLLAAEPEQDKKPEQKPPASASTADKPAAKKSPAPAPAAAPMRFTDEDLEKYRKPKPPAPDGDVEDETESEPAGPVAVPQAPTAPAPPASKPSAPKPSASKPAAPKPAAPKLAPSKSGPVAGRAPARAEKLPGEDPLKPWKDREALESWRTEQIRGLRERMTSIQERLGYLEQKRLAIVDPLRIMPKPRTTEEADQDKGKGSRDLLESVDAEIESVKAELDAARSDLIAIETHFEQETTPR